MGLEVTFGDVGRWVVSKDPGIASMGPRGGEGPAMTRHRKTLPAQMILRTEEGMKGEHVRCQFRFCTTIRR